jgi:excisionase family DNA binding protein
MPIEILRLSEAARRIGVSTLELLRMVRRGEIEFVLVDRVPRIPADVVERHRRMAS